MKLLLRTLTVLVALVLPAAPASAQTSPTGRAVLRVAGTRDAQAELRHLIEQRSGRVAVIYNDLWVIRASQMLENELRGDARVSAYFRGDDASTTRSSSDIASDLAKHLAEAADHHPEHQAVGLSCIPQETEPIDYAALESMITTRKSPAPLAAAGTSDMIVGTTTVAVFFPANTGVRDPVAVELTETLQQSILANIVSNLAWWSDVAAAYGTTATFTLKPYFADDPVCAIPFDPTKSTTPGDMLKDLSFQDSIMAYLGYTTGNRTTKMRAFLEDLRVQEGTDWAYIAWIVSGVNAIRSNAAFNGPSTNLWYNSAKSGSTFAHETGHIFGAFDEYYEEGTEMGRYRQSRNGAPNANFDFRNHPVVPCMMRTNMTEGICSYTAVHIGLTDSVHYTTVTTTPEHGTFEASYYRPGATQAGIAERYQGTTKFPWGSGMKSRLQALATVSCNSDDEYGSPVWDSSGDNMANVTATQEHQTVTLSYSTTGNPSVTAWEYLAPDEGPAGGQVYTIIPTGERSAVFGTFNGISLFDNGTRSYLDIPFIGSRLETEFRQCYSAATLDGTFYFGTHGSEVLGWKDDSLTHQLTVPFTNLDIRALAPMPDGGLWVGTDSGLVHFTGTGHQVYTTANSRLLSNGIVSLLADRAGRIWIGMGKGGRTGGSGGLQVFDPGAGTWTDFSNQLPDLAVQAIRALNDSSIAVATGNGFAIFDGTRFTSHTSQPHRNVKDITLDAAGNIVVATQGGIGRRKGTAWETYTTANSELPDNFCFSIARGTDGRLWIGTLNGTVAILSFRDSEGPLSAPHIISSGNGVELEQNHPNPFDGTSRIRFTTAHSGHATLRLFDLLGREHRVVLDRNIGAGTYTAELSAEGLNDGIYFYQLQINDIVRTRQFIVTGNR